MINLEIPKKLQDITTMAHQFANDGLRPISRKYDLLEQEEMPEELYPLSELLLAGGVARSDKPSISDPDSNRNGRSMMAALVTEQMCWGDTGLFLAMPGLGLGNAAVQAVASAEQKQEWGELFASMAITEPGCGSDSAAIKTTAVLDGDEWVINGSKIFVTDGYRSKQVVVWASLDTSLGKAAIKSFLVPKGTPGMEVTRLEHKLGIRSSDTAQIVFDNCRVPKANLLGNPEIAKTDAERKKAFGGVMQTFDNTRPIVAAQALGVARAALDLTTELLQEKGLALDYNKSYHQLSAIENDLYDMEADYEAARLLVLKASWMADNKQPNSKNASMSKAKAGRMGNQVALKCVELCGQLGYSKAQLLEKFARDSKIIDIYEGTQQIQQLIVARQVLGKSSSELK
ncbi:acyl-CoA dehydrogenase family protein [Oceanicoccus sagamiensis]|uniref:3-sulfinopropanoyl-CoA desulfinase n=1 Tax=Oceanicoccus sagamiensis TaxID=716816 RepID=A0A1X9NI71_9GAMM|nr:acyl-CoA dehydrogenase family protein [Oceanicoccus sagamiensis]ARN75209.1 acyl-CoA dehydrogenase [Oceanicoccus sagamiensis]